MNARVVNPPELGAPRGYSNGIEYPRGRLLFVAGQVGWDANQRLLSEDLVEQFDRALANVLAVVRSAGGTPDSIGRLTLYVKDKKAYQDARVSLGRAYRARMGSHYPAMSLVQVADLLEDGALVEIEATAVIDAG